MSAPARPAADWATTVKWRVVLELFAITVAYALSAKLGLTLANVAQQAWFAEVLKRNADARWTFVFMHKPAWIFADADHEQTGWNGIERALGDRKYTVFAGHVHNYARFVRNGRDHIMLATTGGASKLRGKADGEFDQIVWVTMKDSEPVIANLLLDGIEDKAVRNLHTLSEIRVRSD